MGSKREWLQFFGASSRWLPYVGLQTRPTFPAQVPNDAVSGHIAPEYPGYSPVALSRLIPCNSLPATWCRWAIQPAIGGVVGGDPVYVQPWFGKGDARKQLVVISA